MGYLGVPPQSGFITTAKQRVTSSTNNYVDLDHSISSIADVIVFVNFVKQDTTNLTLTTSTRITLGGTLQNSDIVEIHYLGKAVNTQTPATGTVTNDMLAGSIANSKLANSSITLNGSAVSLGGSATVGGANTPSFEAYLNTTQDIGDGVMTKITANVERFDTDSAYDHSSNYRFTPQTAGKYYVYLEAVGYSTTGGDTNIIVAYGEIRKNGSRYIYNVDHQPSYGVRQQTINISGIIDMNGSSDYVEPFAEVNVSSGNGTLRGNSDGSLNTKFGAFRIIT